MTDKKIENYDQAVDYVKKYHDKAKASSTGTVELTVANHTVLFRAASFSDSIYDQAAGVITAYGEGENFIFALTFKAGVQAGEHHIGPDSAVGGLLIQRVGEFWERRQFIRGRVQLEGYDVAAGRAKGNLIDLMTQLSEDRIRGHFEFPSTR